MKTLVITLSIAAAICAGVAPALAVDAHDSHGSAAVSETRQEMTEGEIRKVDKNLGKLTIRHGELKNLGMPPMTMVFQVKDKAVLEQLKAGDKVKFTAEKVDGKLTVMQIEAFP